MKITIKLSHDKKGYSLDASTYNKDFCSVNAGLLSSELPEALIEIFRQRRCLADVYELRISKKAEHRLDENKIGRLEDLVRYQNILAIKPEIKKQIITEV